MSWKSARSVQETNWERIVSLYDLLFARAPRKPRRLPG